MNWTIKTFDELTGKEIYEILRSRAEVFVKEQKKEENISKEKNSGSIY